MLKKSLSIILMVALLTSIVTFGVIPNTTTVAHAAINGLLRVFLTNPLYFTDDSGEAIRLAGHQIFSDMQDNWAIIPAAEAVLQC